MTGTRPAEWRAHRGAGWGTTSSPSPLRLGDGAPAGPRPSSYRDPPPSVPVAHATGYSSWTAARFRSSVTAVYSMVVFNDAWPSSSCTTRMSAPASRRCVANECRSMWAVT